MALASDNNAMAPLDGATDAQAAPEPPPVCPRQQAEWAVIVNSESGPKTLRRARNRKLRAALGIAGLYFETSSLADLEAAAAAIHRRRCPIVALCGGDGTIGNAVTALHRQYRGQPLPDIALLRGGTMNTIARSLGMANGTPARRLVDLRQSSHGRTLSCTTLAVDDKLGFLFSSGIMYGFLAAYNEAGAGQPTPLTAARVLATAAASAAVSGAHAERMARRFRAGLVADGVRLASEEDLLLVGAGTVQQAGLGFRPYRFARPGAHHFHVITYGGGVAGLLQALPQFAIGQGERVDQARSMTCRELQLERDEPLPYALDGDLYMSRGPLTLRCGPTVRFLL